MGSTRPPTVALAFAFAFAFATIHEAGESTWRRRLPIDSVEQPIPLMPLMCALVRSGLAWSMPFSKPAQEWFAGRSEQDRHA